MKLNLLVNQPDGVLSGYLNIDPFAPPDDPRGRQCGRVERLSDFCEANEAEEILAFSVIDHFPMEDGDAVVDHWVSRLAHGGTLVVGAVDVREVARQFLAENIDLRQANVHLHGTATAPKRSVHLLDQLALAIESRGLHIIKKRIHDCRAIVVARRP
jgi:hypothetical protein